MGGIGKSVLAAEFARGCSTRWSFPDGMFWLRFAADSDRIATNLELLRGAFDKDPAPPSDLALTGRCESR